MEDIALEFCLDILKWGKALEGEAMSMEKGEQQLKVLTLQSPGHVSKYSPTPLPIWRTWTLPSQAQDSRL